MRKNQLIGFRNGMLTVMYEAVDVKSREVIWVCQCDCGNTICLQTYLVKKRKSCRCQAIVKFKQRFTKHGMTELSEYNIWGMIKSRCYNENRPDYKNYGGRGIEMCDAWVCSFENFYEDMGKRPSPSHTLDRRDNSKGYSKENCRWATRIEQANNKRNNCIIEINGVSKTMAQWAEYSGLSQAVIFGRKQRGWDNNDLILPLRKIFNKKNKKL